MFSVSNATGYAIASAGVVAGGTAAGMQTYAANSNTGLHEYGFAVGLGAGFGGWMPLGGERSANYTPGGTLLRLRPTAGYFFARRSSFL